MRSIGPIWVGTGAHLARRNSLAVTLGMAIGCTQPEPPAPSAPAPAISEKNARSEAPPAPSPASQADATPPVVPAAWPPKMPAGVETDWCIAAVRALDEETCFVLPDRPTTSLLIYLHGIVPPERESFQKTNYETVVSNTSRRAGVVALMPRGKQGLAPKGQERWWGWPTSETAYGKYTLPLSKLLADKKNELEQALGVHFDKTYLAGSSSGAYFVAALALRGAFSADGFGAMSGGAGQATPELAKLEPRPFYIGFGTHDSVGPAAKSLGKLLQKAGWPVRIAAHPVGHGAREVYLDEAFEFWRSPQASTSKSSSE